MIIPGRTSSHTRPPTLPAHRHHTLDNSAALRTQAFADSALQPAGPLMLVIDNTADRETQLYLCELPCAQTRPRSTFQLRPRQASYSPKSSPVAPAAPGPPETALRLLKSARPPGDLPGSKS
ncbi:unnamed protein product [Peniophora sp. CBMAI 1063]|nr:unnamed protein product [Peniophora sp. CBMAI 1063]